MRVSIITVVYNGKNTIAHTIESVLAQRYPHIEHIVVDGHSTDGTQQILAGYHQLQWISQPDKGIYDAMNKGIGMASGQIIGFLNADDFFAAPTVVEDLVEVFAQQPVDALYGDLAYVDARQISRITRYWKAGSYRPGSFRYGWMPPHPTFYVRREVYQRYGGFNPAFRSAADYELMLRLIHKHAISLAYLPQLMVLMRRGGKSNASLKNRLAANGEDRRAWQINNLSPHALTLLLKPLRKVEQFIVPASKADALPFITNYKPVIT